MNLTLNYLFFAVPPDPPVILDPNGRRVGSLIGPYDEGESLSITCMSSKGNNFGFDPFLSRKRALKAINGQLVCYSNIMY